MDKTALYREIEEMFGKVPEWIRLIPDTALSGFWLQFRDFYFAETKIPNKYKELIGLGVSGATIARSSTRRPRSCTAQRTRRSRKRA
jgi:alkylhydroperoxidase/carboxymuconolactone decarboxylase family protein YurZ